MKKFFVFLLRTLILGAILWLLVSRWIGINIPLLRKSSPTQELLDQRIQLPKGFSVSVYADDLPGARILRMTKSGDLLLSLPHKGRIVLLKRDEDGNGKPDGRYELINGLNLPHGMDFYRSWLYIAETGSVGRIRFDDKTRLTSGEYERIITDIPSGGGHWSRTIKFSQDGFMYVSVGSNCNVCEEKNPKRAALLRYLPDGSHGEIYASGLRNTVGFDWHPITKELYGVDNGRDYLRDDFPPCELNRIEQGKFYGWPYANGNRISDPDFGQGNEQIILKSMPPAYEFNAHTAPLGITFIRGESLPSRYKNSALVALHGSWNRTEKIGYQVILLHFDKAGHISEHDFMTGFEVDGDVIGRPVDIAEDKNGNIYISDDFTGSVYRVTYQ